MRLNIFSPAGGSNLQFTRITVDPDQMGCVPSIRGLRIPVATVVGMVADGMSEDQILSLFPDVEHKDIQEALQYASETFRQEGTPLKF